MSLERQQSEYSIPEENGSSYLKRLYIYQKERFPVLGHGLLVASFSFSAIAYSRICRGAVGFVNLTTYLTGIFITISLFLLVRIFDEFKDAEDDAKYRSELPVPRGLVSLKELGVLGVIIVIAQIGVILCCFPQMFWLYLLVAAYLCLMGKEFFIAKWLKKHQLWYVISHMFIIPLVDMFASGLDWKLANVHPPQGLLFFFAVSYMNGIVLEVGRKIRIPEKEAEGVLTYSGLLGANKAVFLWIAVLIVTLALSIGAGIFAGYGIAAIVVLGLVFLICAIPAILFLNRKTQKLSKLIEYASAFWTMMMYLTLGGGPMLSNLLFK